MAMGLLAVAAALAGHGFTLGVAAGEVTPTGALIWAKSTRSGPVTAEVARDARFRHLVFRRVIRARSENDLTAQARVSGLRPGTRYVYRFRHGRLASATGHFETAPPPNRAATVRFAYSGDADAQPPGSNHFEIYGRMAAERNDFDINLGDTIYSDSEVPNTPPALTLAAKRAKYRRNIAQPALLRLRMSAGVYNHWDDHEFINDFSRAENGAEYAPGVRAFREYMPVTYTSQRGLYRTFRWGRNVQLFFLDERSFRSAKASAGGACTTPAGTPDLAPTAPQGVRNAFAALIPALARPVAPTCLATIDDPNRTLLGAGQYARFTSAIAASTATWKVVVNEVPIQQFYALPYDRWEGYAAERERLLHFLHDNVRNVVFLTTDTHATFVNEARFQTLEPGGPSSSGVEEVVTGPVATRTFAKEIDAAVGSSGSGLLISGLFFKPPPPRGIGMQCVSPDTYSYAEVVATAQTLTVTPKDAEGHIVNDVTGQPCSPLVLQAR
jgi:alkaline phosphatase D